MRVRNIILYCCLLVGLAACDNLSGTNILDKSLEKGDPYFAMLYNKKFAKRFSLSEGKAVSLFENLQAISVEINKNNFRYTCELHLYVDDKLDIYKPEMGDYYSDKPISEYFFVIDYNDKDLNWNSYVDLNHMRIRFDSTLQVDSGLRFTRTLSYNRIHSSFLPGLTVVTLNTHCGIFNGVYYPANIWIQKQDVGDYLVGNDGLGGVKHEEKNYRFPIPIALIEQIQPYIEIAVKYNDERL